MEEWKLAQQRLAAAAAVANSALNSMSLGSDDDDHSNNEDVDEHPDEHLEPSSPTDNQVGTLGELRSHVCSQDQDGSQHNMMRLTFFECIRQIKALACQQDVYPRDDLVGAAINLAIKSVVHRATAMHQGKGGQPYRAPYAMQTAALHVDGIHAATKAQLSTSEAQFMATKLKLDAKVQHTEALAALFRSLREDERYPEGQLTTSSYEQILSMIHDTSLASVKDAFEHGASPTSTLSIMMSACRDAAQQGWLELEQEQYNNAILASLSDMTLQNKPTRSDGASTSHAAYQVPRERLEREQYDYAIQASLVDMLHKQSSRPCFVRTEVAPSSHAEQAEPVHILCVVQHAEDGAPAENATPRPAMPSSDHTTYAGATVLAKKDAMAAALEAWGTAVATWQAGITAAQVRREDALVRTTVSKLVVLGGKDNVLALPDWLQFTRGNLVTRAILDERKQVGIAATYLRGQYMRRWDTTLSQLKPTDAITWSRFSSALLSSQEGKHPAEQSRQSFTNMRFKTAVSSLANMLHYDECYERMIEHCADSHVTVPSSYDLATHYLAFANMASMQVSVAVQSVWVTITSTLQEDVPMPAGQTVSDVYATAFLKMRERGLTTAKVQDTREQRDRLPPAVEETKRKRDNGNGNSHDHGNTSAQNGNSQNQKANKRTANGKQKGSSWNSNQGPSGSNREVLAQAGPRSTQGLKDHLVSNGVNLSLLNFGGRSGTCYYCGDAHSAHLCSSKKTFGSDDRDQVRAHARSLGNAYFKK